MRIDRLELKNFKGFAERTLEFHPRFNLLIGENGSGKSSILEAVVIGLQDWLHVFGAGSVKGFDEALVRITRVESAGGLRFEPSDSAYLDAAGTTFEEAFRVRWMPRNARGDASLVGWQINRRYQESLDKPVTLPLPVFYTANRLTHPASPRPDPFETKADLSRAKAYDGCADGYLTPEHLIAWFKREEFIRLQTGKSGGPLEVARKAILGCLEGGVDLQYSVQDLDLLIHFERNGWQPFGNLSDGQKSIVAMVGEIAYRCAWLNPHLGSRALEETPGVILIDELDLHLHPRWQRRVIDDLKRTFPAMQFICTTHSPFLIQSLDPGELIQLDPGKETLEYSQRSIEDIVETIQGVEMPQRGRRREQMEEAAEHYFTLLRQKDHVSAAELDAAEVDYRTASEAYTDQPAIHALLKLERLFADHETKPD
jgi:predicted ATP-binding protein involved in virulence